jgi:hypothetical protein
MGVGCWSGEIQSRLPILTSFLELQSHFWVAGLPASWTPASTAIDPSQLFRGWKWYVACHTTHLQMWLYFLGRTYISRSTRLMYTRIAGYTYMEYGVLQVFGLDYWFVCYLFILEGARASLEFAMYPRLALNSQYFCFNLLMLSAGIIGMHNHAPTDWIFKILIQLDSKFWRLMWSFYLFI